MAVIDTRKPAKATTRPGKEKVVAEVAALLEKSSMVFSLPSSHITANQVVALRKGLPDGCTAKVVKNTLMRIACTDSEFGQLADITTGENFWMFVEGEDNLAEPIKYVAEFAKEFDKAAVSSSSISSSSSCSSDRKSQVHMMYMSRAVGLVDGGGGSSWWWPTSATRTRTRTRRKPRAPLEEHVSRHRSCWVFTDRPRKRRLFSERPTDAGDRC